MFTVSCAISNREFRYPRGGRVIWPSPGTLFCTKIFCFFGQKKLRFSIVQVGWLVGWDWVLLGVCLPKKIMLDLALGAWMFFGGWPENPFYDRLWPISIPELTHHPRRCKALLKAVSSHEWFRHSSLSWALDCPDKACLKGLPGAAATSICELPT